MGIAPMPLSPPKFSSDGRVSPRVFSSNHVVSLVLPVAVVSSLVDAKTGDRAADGPACLVSCWLLSRPSIAMQAKRWHDIDESAWWVFIGIIPIIGVIRALITDGFLPGTAGRDRFGDDPLVR